MTPTDRRNHREGSRTPGATRTGKGEARIISCPFCARRYRLPASLMGPRGVRIRCPGCQGRYVLVAGSSSRAAQAPRIEARRAPVASDVSSAEPSAPEPAASPPRPAQAPDVLESHTQTRASAASEPPESEPAEASLPEHDDVPASEAEQLAIDVLEALVLETGGQLSTAHAHGRLFAEFGPLLLHAFDVYRARAGESADAAVFRQVLRQRCGVDLGVSH